MATTNGDYVWNTWTSSTASTGDSYYYNTADVWSNWSSPTSTSTIHDNTSRGQIWYQWSNDHEKASKKFTIYTDSGERDYTAVWTTWISNEECATPERFGAVQDTIREQINKAKASIPEPSTEERRARRTQGDLQLVWNKVLADEREQERKEAELTAQDLLLDIIGKDALQRYKDTDRLFVKGEKFDYVLSKGRGVHRIEKDKVVDFLEKKKAIGQFICIHPKQNYNYPETDNVITLKLWIENNEDQFLKIGNLHKGTEEIANFDKVVNG